VFDNIKKLDSKKNKKNCLCGIKYTSRYKSNTRHERIVVYGLKKKKKLYAFILLTSTLRVCTSALFWRGERGFGYLILLTSIRLNSSHLLLTLTLTTDSR